MKVLSAILVAVLGAACASSPGRSGPYDPPSELERNTVQAESLSREAADRLGAGDLNGAEELLRESLTADLLYGPAHNNLGVVFLKQGKLYEAAQEFEWAKKLLPSAADPRVNLALVLESAGREEDALVAWQNALEVAPGCLQALQGMARLSLARGESMQGQADALEAIGLQGGATWRDWALGIGARGAY